MATYLKVRSILPPGRAALHDEDPDHPPSKTFPEGGFAVVDGPGDFIVASTRGVHDAIAKGRLMVVQGEVSEREALGKSAAVEKAVEAPKPPDPSPKDARPSARGAKK